MRILYCIPSLGIGGAERQLAHVAGALARRGHEIHVACGRGGPLHDALSAAGATVHLVGGAGAHDPRVPIRLVRLLAALRPDVVQTCLTQMDVLGGAAALLTGTPWVLRESSGAAMYGTGWKDRSRRALGRLADAVVANSEAGDAYWCAAGARRRRVVPNGVAPNDVAPDDVGPDGVVPDDAPGDGTAVPAPPGRPVVLFAGRMDDAKNAGAVVEALGRLAASADFVALLCGDGPRRADLEARATRLGLADRVRFPGCVTDLAPLMRRADVVVSLSRVEGCPNVVLEAMACGRPLVVSDIHAHRSLVDASSAWLVPPDDAAAAAIAIGEALRRPLSDPSGEGARRARAASARAERFTVPASADGYERVYREVARSPR